MLAFRPACVDRPRPHAAPRLRIAVRLPDMAGDHHDHGEGEPVVDEGGPGAPEERGEVREPHQQAGGEHDEHGAGDPGGVELLAGVELARRAAAPVAAERGAQPAAVVPAVAVEAGEVGAQRAGGQAQQQRDRQQDAGPLVDGDHEGAAADEFGEEGEVEAARGEDTDGHEGGGGAVHPAFGGGEAGDPAGRRAGRIAGWRAGRGAGRAAVRWSAHRRVRSSGRPRRRRHSRAPPRNPVPPGR